MSNETKISVMPLPELCDECGQTLAWNVIANPDRNAFSQHCPHLGVAATAFVGEHQGRPAIMTWRLIGPGLSE